MKEEQVDRLLEELARTRESFDQAIKSIKWNRFNTIVQYVLISVIVVMLAVGTNYWVAEKRASCERGNDLRRDIQNSLDKNAGAIGIALTIVTGAPDERLQEYIDAYNQQDKPAVLRLREC